MQVYINIFQRIENEIIAENWPSTNYYWDKKYIWVMLIFQLKQKSESC